MGQSTVPNAVGYRAKRVRYRRA